LLLPITSIPFSLVLAGTDVNEFWRKSTQMEAMSAAVCKARSIVAFHCVQVEQFAKVHVALLYCFAVA
jgi:hypothetical protein